MQVRIMKVRTIPIKVFTINDLVNLRPFLIMNNNGNRRIFASVKLTITRDQAILRIFPYVISARVRICLSYEHVNTRIRGIATRIHLKGGIFVTRVHVNGTGSNFSTIRACSNKINNNSAYTRRIKHVIKSGRRETFCTIRVLRRI